MDEELYSYTTEDEALDIPSRPLYLVLNDQNEVTDLSFEDTGHHYQDVPEERDLDYWREFFELKSHRLTFVDGLLVSEPRQTATASGHGVTEEEVEARIKAALDGQREEFLSILDAYSKKRTTKPKL